MGFQGSPLICTRRVTIGTGYVLFAGVVLEFLGGSGKSESSRYAIVNSLGDLPVVSMTWLDGRCYLHWGPRAMSGMDARVSATVIPILLANFVISRRHKMLR